MVKIKIGYINLFEFVFVNTQDIYKFRHKILSHD